MITGIQRAFAPVKRWTPQWLWSPARRVATAILAPVLYSYRRGHLRSSLTAAAMTRGGEPLPWYTYPMIEFLSARDFSDARVLEFGAGQSTLWWSARAAKVVSIDESEAWLRRLRKRQPMNVELHHATIASPEACAAAVGRILDQHPPFDVVIIDGLIRKALIPVALKYRAPGGIVICDNAEGYGFREGFIGSMLKRVDFFGMVPGVVLPHCTSIYFDDGSRVFDATFPIPAAARL